MITVREQLARLDDATASGELAAICRENGVELVLLFGSAVDGTNPGDIDVAIAFGRETRSDLISFVDALSELVPGDHLDVMDVDRAGPVAAQRALTRCRVLYTRTSAAFQERQIFAINHYIDTQPFRDLLRESLLG